MRLVAIAVIQAAATGVALTIAVLVERHEDRRRARAITDTRPRLPMPRVPQQRRPTYVPIGSLPADALERLLAQLGPCRAGTNCAGHANKTCQVAPCCATCPTDPPEVTP